MPELTRCFCGRRLLRHRDGTTDCISCNRVPDECSCLLPQTSASSLCVSCGHYRDTPNHEFGCSE